MQTTHTRELKTMGETFDKEKSRENSFPPLINVNLSLGRDKVPSQTLKRHNSFIMGIKEKHF